LSDRILCGFVKELETKLRARYGSKFTRSWGIPLHVGAFEEFDFNGKLEHIAYRDICAGAVLESRRTNLYEIKTGPPFPFRLFFTAVHSSSLFVADGLQ
jgi:hypothetical protein